MLISGNLYIPDTSALIAAWEERYPPDIFPAVWEFLDGLNGRLRVCKEVQNKSTPNPVKQPAGGVGGGALGCQHTASTVIPAQAGIQNPGCPRPGGKAGCGFPLSRE